MSGSTVKFQDKDTATTSEISNTSTFVPMVQSGVNKKLTIPQIHRDAVAVCSIAANVAAKTATVNNMADFALINGITVTVNFTNGNTAESPTLNVNNTGAFRLIKTNQTVSANPSIVWAANSFLELKYIEVGSNKYWLITSIDDYVNTTINGALANYQQLKLNTSFNGTVQEWIDSLISNKIVLANGKTLKFDIPYSWNYNLIITDFMETSNQCRIIDSVVEVTIWTSNIYEIIFRIGSDYSNTYSGIYRYSKNTERSRSKWEKIATSSDLTNYAKSIYIEARSFWNGRTIDTTITTQSIINSLNNSGYTYFSLISVPKDKSTFHTCSLTKTLLIKDSSGTWHIKYTMECSNSSQVTGGDANIYAIGLA